MPNQKQQEEAHRRIDDRRQRLLQSRKKSPIAAIVKRFVEIDGGNQATLVSLQFFTAVIPLMIIGFDYFSGFAASASVGDLFIRQLGLHPPLDARVREAFGSASSMRSIWSVIGVAGFLAAGIPMAVTIAQMFARAWRREQFGLVEKLARGTAWFVLYLGTMAARERICLPADHGVAARAALLFVALVLQWAFWSLTPVLLVRNGGRGLRFLMLAGCVGVVVDELLLDVAAPIVFPVLLEGWTGFGPMGVAMTLMTWCGVVATAWVVIACVGAIVWERSAPAETVVESQTAVPEPPAVTS
jgi:hypothetical protein